MSSTRLLARHSPRVRFVGFCAITLLTTLALTLATEAISRAILRANSRETYPLLIDRGALTEPVRSYQQRWGHRLVVSYVDPHLGFAHNPTAHPLYGTMEGFVPYGRNPSADPDGLVIVCLGGSTTDPVTPIALNDDSADPLDPYNWPRSLARLLDSSGVPATVFNGGVAGYSSSQGLFKLIRDVLPLRPDIVIEMNGVNEFYGHAVPGHPMVHQYQAMLVQRFAAQARSVLLPNTVALTRWTVFGRNRWIEGSTLGPVSSASAAEHWHDNLRSAQAVCTGHGITYVGVLQPILGYGQYPTTSSEDALLDERGEAYRRSLEAFYSEASARCLATEGCADLTDLFADTPQAYLDARHQNERGVERLAEAVFDLLRARGLVNPEPAPAAQP